MRDGRLAAGAGGTPVAPRTGRERRGREGDRRIRTGTPATGAWLLLLAAGCGGGDGDDAPAADAETAAEPAKGVVGRAPAAVRGVPAAVELVPASGEAPLPPAEPAHMDQSAMAFGPDLLVVRVGQTLEFTNSEAIAHNVHVRATETGETVFNVDTDVGARAAMEVTAPGGYDVSCDVHPGMAAFIFAAEAPYATFASPDGTFRMPDVPPGRYTLRIWHVDPERRSEREVDVGEGRTEIPETSGAP